MYVGYEEPEKIQQDIETTTRKDTITKRIKYLEDVKKILVLGKVSGK
jgi:hypothetical protein